MESILAARGVRDGAAAEAARFQRAARLAHDAGKLLVRALERVAQQRRRRRKTQSKEQNECQ